MNPILRYARFNLVGAMGMAVQLAALALLNRWTRGHYLFASAVAIELTLLHNFVWHLHFTWRDRRHDSSRLRQFVRFHLSNGLVSLVGNLTLMRLLVQHAHLPVLAANLFAILCCSVLNFCLGNLWAFAAPHHSKSARAPVAPRPAPVSALMPLFVLACATSHAQTPPDPSSQTPAPALPQAPMPQPKPAPTIYHPKPSDSYVFNLGAFCGVGASKSPAGTLPTTGCGAGFTALPFVFVEVGIMAPQANRSYLTGYIAVDGTFPLAHLSTKYLPLAIFGYTASSKPATPSTTALPWLYPVPARKRTTTAVSASSCATTGPSPIQPSTTSCCASAGWSRSTATDDASGKYWSRGPEWMLPCRAP